MSVWCQICSFLDACALYFTLQLVRCVIFSVMLLCVVMFLRKTLFSKCIFLKGILWSLFLLVPFLGKLKMFYENVFVVKITWWLTESIMENPYIARIYMAGVLIACIYVFGNRIYLSHMVSRFKRSYVCSREVYITDMNITPFAVGLLKPRVVLPKIIQDNYSNEELNIILRHEYMHIKLGHLWCYFLWDILKCLLWLNPLLALCQRQFRMDLEDICDRVCIQNNDKTAQEYGLLLLKSIRLLRTEREGVSSAVTFTGEKDFKEMKRRIKKIANFKSYRKNTCRGMIIIAAVFIFTVFMGIKKSSYDRCSEIDSIIVYSYDVENGNSVILDSSKHLQQIISYDDSYLYIDREAFDKIVYNCGESQEIFIVFGGYQKLPGIGGNGSTCLYEAGSNDKIIAIPYEKAEDNWMTILFKLL